MKNKELKKKNCTQRGDDACEGQLASLLGTQENKIKNKHENIRQNLATTNFDGFPSLTQCYFSFITRSFIVPPT